MRITQSISLSNIQIFSFAEKAQPWGCRNLPKTAACFEVAVTVMAATSKH